MVVSLSADRLVVSNSLKIVKEPVDKVHKDKSRSQPTHWLNVISGGDNGPYRECEKRANSGNKINWTSSEPVYEERHGYVRNKAPRFQATIYPQLGVRLCDAHVVHNLIQVV